MKAKPTRSPARAALAAAIDAHSTAVDERRKLEATRENTASFLSDAEEALRKAQEALGAAQAGRAARITEAASAGVCVATAPDMKVQNLRLDEAAAQEEVDVARAALASIDAKLVRERDFMGQPADPVSLAFREVEAASRRVFEEHADAAMAAMLDEFDKAMDEAQRAGARIAALVEMGAIGSAHHETLASRSREAVAPYVDALGSEGSRRLQATWPGPRDRRDTISPAAEAVRAAHRNALAALCTNPDAELPA